MRRGRGRGRDKEAPSLCALPLSGDRDGSEAIARSFEPPVPELSTTSSADVRDNPVAELAQSFTELVQSRLGFEPERDLISLCCRVHCNDPNESPAMTVASVIWRVAERVDSWIPSWCLYPAEVCYFDRREELWAFLNAFFIQLTSQSFRELFGDILDCASIAAWLTNRVLSEESDLIPSIISSVVLRAAALSKALFTMSAILTREFQFIRTFTVNSANGSLHVHVDRSETQSSDFRVFLVDSLAGLLTLLGQLSALKHRSHHEPVALGVDLEGVALSRSGPVALVQICLSSDPTTVHIIDIAKLSGAAFYFTDPQGTSLQRVLEDEAIRKVLFDPRNDVDALFHQFAISVRNVFDLQIAEVALRRARGLTVRYVQGLYKCLQAQSFLTEQQRQLAETINNRGKALFEPECGGSYETFLQRPLHSDIIVYASHDARYLLPLMEVFEEKLKVAENDWLARVFNQSQIRAQWYMHPDYVNPTSDAPSF